MGTVKIELNPEEMTNRDWDKFQNAMDDLNDMWDQEIRDIAKDFGVSTDCAQSIWYLRTRSRWSQEKEDYLIELDKKGEPMPDYNDY